MLEGPPVMDHRDSSRTDPDGPGDSFAGLRAPFARIVDGRPADRRWAFGKVAAGAAVALSVVLLMFTGGARAVRSAVAWLHQRESYTLNFREITLVPEPPPWIKSGREGLLERVRSRAGRPEQISVLEIDLKELANDFRRESPWVLDVDRVSRTYPNHLELRLAYRRPAAALRVGAGVVILDRDGVVLPEDDVNRSAAPMIDLVRVLPPNLDPSSLEALPGKLFRARSADPEHSDADAEVVSDAARLAGFFVDRDAAGPDARAKVGVNAIHWTARRFFVETTTTTMILWGQAPGAEPPGDPKAGEKWEMLVNWAESHTLAGVQNPAYLAFEQNRVVVKTGRVRE
jgi:hypothetical protein